MKEYYKEALANDTNIWVSPNGNDEVNNGYFESPFRTIEKAVAAITTSRLNVILMPGAYTITTDINITVNGTTIIGLGGVAIDCTGCTTYGFKTVFGTASGTKSFAIENVSIEHGAKLGILLTNTGATAKVNCYLKNVETGSNSAAYHSVGIINLVAGQAIRLYADHCLFEGVVNTVFLNAGDRNRFEHCILRGGYHSDTGAVASEILFRNCTILHEGVTGGASAQRIISLYSMSETDADPNVYALIDTNDLAGSQTETLMLPVS